MHIDVKSADGNYFIKDRCTRFEDLPYNEFKKRIAFRKEYWPIRSWKELSLYKEFTDADFRRLTPYFRFD